MNEHWDETLRGIEVELGRQDREWKNAKAAIAALGDAEFAVPREAIAELEHRASPITPMPLGIRA
jgi:hypothetical protein